MGQSSSIQEDKMKKRIRQTMGTFMDFGAHLANANEWARLCPTPKTCFLAFRIVVDPGVAPEVLPYVWRIPGNVSVEVRKMRRREDGELSPRGRRGELDAEETIGQAKTLTVRQFYYIYCFLSDIKACAAVRFPDKSTSPDNVDPDFDETECQICMDKRKEVMLPCTHSFCLYCFQHWSAQSQTCPICRAKIDCSEGDELWQLTSNEIDDIDSYATDLVARIYEYLDKRDKSEHSEADIKRSAEVYVAALAVKQTHFHKLVHTELFPTALPLGFPSILRHGIRLGSEFDTDIMLALELASGEDQHAALQYFQQLRRDQVLAMAMAVEAEADGVDVGLGAFEP